MERSDFSKGSWWISDDQIPYAVAEQRVRLGSAFGWSSTTWQDEEERLGDLYDFLNSQQASLLVDVDQITYEDQQRQWLEKVIDLKTTPPPSTPVDTDGSTQPEPVTVTKDPTPETQPVRSKPLFGKKTGGDTPGLPSIDHLSAMEKTLLAGALEKKTIDEAVAQIYDNMHTKTGWKYNASIPNVNGTAYITGAAKDGMCESYRNAFGAILKVYDGLRASHPEDAIKNGGLDIDGDDSLAAERFVTREGLTLMGGLQGNVYLKVDGRGAILARGADSINRFVFKGHWTSTVNGKVYDPIFYSIGENNVGALCDENYVCADGRFIPNIKLPVPTGEFGATFVWVTDWDEFEGTVKAMKELYAANSAEIDDILAGKKTIKQDRGGKNRDCYTQAAALVKKQVANMSIFKRVAEDSAQVLRASEIAAVAKIIDLASKTA